MYVRSSRSSYGQHLCIENVVSTPTSPRPGDGDLRRRRGYQNRRPASAGASRRQYRKSLGWRPPGWAKFPPTFACYCVQDQDTSSIYENDLGSEGREWKSPTRDLGHAEGGDRNPERESLQTRSGSRGISKSPFSPYLCRPPFNLWSIKLFKNQHLWTI
jgi:hypothetical protein